MWARTRVPACVLAPSLARMVVCCAGCCWMGQAPPDVAHPVLTSGTVVQRSRASNHPPLEQARGGRHCFSLNLDVQLYTKYSCICAVSTCRAEPEVRCIWV